MIQHELMYGCKCDGCGDQWDNGDTISYYADKELTLEGIRDSEWHVTDDERTYCPECWSYDDNDNLVFKSASPSPVREEGKVPKAKDTGLIDKNGDQIREGDKLSHKNFDGKTTEWIVVWNNWGGGHWEGENADEIYHLGPTLFKESTLIKSHPPACQTGGLLVEAITRENDSGIHVSKLLVELKEANDKLAYERHGYKEMQDFQQRELAARQIQIDGLLEANRELGEKWLKAQEEALEYRKALMHIRHAGDIRDFSTKLAANALAARDHAKTNNP